LNVRGQNKGQIIFGHHLKQKRFQLRGDNELVGLQSVPRSVVIAIENIGRVWGVLTVPLENLEKYYD